MKLSDTQPQNSPVTISQLPNTNLNTQDLYALGNGQASQHQNVKIKFFDQQNTPQNATKENIDPNAQNQVLNRPCDTIITNAGSSKLGI